jgi:hypothetical protein
LQKHHLLKGFIFSGTTASSDSPYLFYGDKHAPAPTPQDHQTLVPESLMTETEMKKTLAELAKDKLDFLGLKVMPLPLPSDSRESLVYIDHLLNFLAQNVS